MHHESAKHQQGQRHARHDQPPSIQSHTEADTCYSNPESEFDGGSICRHVHGLFNQSLPTVKPSSIKTIR
jgi:hypothetical protein